jgi:hypothetical protein
MYPGLCNQVDGIAGACMIAKKLNRTLILPDIVIRRKALDFVEKQPSELRKLSRKFEDVFDIHTFKKKINIPLVRDSNQLNNLSVSPPIDINKKYLDSDQIASYFSRFEHFDILVIDCPSEGVCFRPRPSSNNKDYSFRLNVSKSIIPSKRLMKYMQKILKGILSTYPAFNAAQFRYEEDWLKAPCTGTGTVPDSRKKLDAKTTVNILKKEEFLKELPLYIAAKDNPDYLKYFQKYFKIAYKTKFIPDIEDVLDFEERAIIDRAICLESKYFFGNHKSTFSIDIVNQKGESNSSYYTVSFYKKVKKVSLIRLVMRFIRKKIIGNKTKKQ